MRRPLDGCGVEVRYDRYATALLSELNRILRIAASMVNDQ